MLILAFVAVVFFLGCILNFVGFRVHYEMTTEACEKQGYPWDYVSFGRFKKEFDKVSWVKGENYSDSRFGEDRNANYFHASIIIIDKKGMVLWPWAYPQYFLFCWFLASEKKRSLRTKGLWAKDKVEKEEP